MFFFQVFQDLYWAIYLSLLGPCSLPRAMLVRLVNLGLQKPYSMLSFSLQNLVLAYFEFLYSHSCPMPQMQEYFVKKNDLVEVVCMIWCLWTVSEFNSVVSFFVRPHDYTHKYVYSLVYGTQVSAPS